MKQVICEFHDHGVDGCEAQLVRNGEVSARRRFDARAQALAYADAIRAPRGGRGVEVVIGTASDPTL